MKKFKKVDDSELYWFWRLTTKWYFFPAYYLILAFLFIVTIYQKRLLELSITSILFEFLLAIVYMPYGLIYLIGIPKYGLNYRILSYGSAKENMIVIFNWILYFIIIALFIYLSILIYYYKRKKNIVLKWLIIALFLLVTLSFLGCVIDYTINPPRF